MLRNILILLGFLCVLFYEHIAIIDITIQFIIFVSGILLLGIPHGAADLLVAEKSAGLSNKLFSKKRFLLLYLTRLLLFACVFVFLPLLGFVLFILFAAYHFGETDLNRFNTNNQLGKIFAMSYGLLILNVIILYHFDEVLPLLRYVLSGHEIETIIDLISDNRYYVLICSALQFFIFTFIYFIKNPQSENRNQGLFLIHLASLLIILCVLPLLLAFTFYFVFWHSLLSLVNIYNYLCSYNSNAHRLIFSQIIIFSLLAVLGSVLMGFACVEVFNKDAIAGTLFISLAVLTAPHLEIMYEMYTTIRKNQISVLR